MKLIEKEHSIDILGDKDKPLILYNFVLKPGKKISNQNGLILIQKEREKERSGKVGLFHRDIILMAPLNHSEIIVGIVCLSNVRFGSKRLEILQINSLDERMI